MSNLKEEVFKVIYLNSANVVLAAEDLFKGTVDQSAVYPREIIFSSPPAKGIIVLL
jgi:DNA repair protein RadC